MKIEDNEILHKMIDMLSYIVKGRSMQSSLEANIDFFLEKSGADIISIYMHEHEKVKIEYILERDRHFADLFRKYVPEKNNLKWEKFVANLDKYFVKGIKYNITTDLYKLSRGFLSNKEARSFASELNMKSSVMMPIYSSDDKSIIGYVCFLSKEETRPDLGKLEMVKSSFQMLLRPLYNKESNTIYNKCVRVDENMDMLTAQERKIVKVILKGVSYHEAAKTLHISRNTLKTHMKNIFYKYNVNSKLELYNKLHIHA